MCDFHLIMPMGGNGSRFKSLNLNQPKPLIEIYGKPFFYWATKSVTKFVEPADITFVVLKEHIAQFKIDEEILKFFPKAKIVTLEKVLNGPVLTCMRGVEWIADDLPVLFNDCDHLFKCESFNKICKNGTLGEIDGAILSFKSNEPQYSYAKTDENGCVTGTVEKNAVSNDAICGAYLFKNKAQFLSAGEKYLKNCGYSEYFMSGIYNELAKNNAKVIIHRVDFHISFGTPGEYTAALTDKNYLELI